MNIVSNIVKHFINTKESIENLNNRRNVVAKDLWIFFWRYWWKSTIEGPIKRKGTCQKRIECWRIFIFTQRNFLDTLTEYCIIIMPKGSIPWQNVYILFSNSQTRLLYYVNISILLVPWLHILKHCYQQEFACKHTKILLVDILVPVFRPHFTVCNPLSNINIWHVCIGSADGLHLVQCTDTLWKNRDPVNAIKRGLERSSSSQHSLKE